jgi:hypothetical protein
MVAFAEMKDRLLTLPQVREKIEATEPLSITFLSDDAQVGFKYEPDWALGLEAKTGIDPVNAFVTVNGTERQLTKDASLQAGAVFGLPGKYAAKLPVDLLERNLNYWYRDGMGDTQFNMLSTGADDQVAAFAKPTIHPYSNRVLLDNVLSGIEQRYGDVEVMADYKLTHSLVKTDIRLIIPEVEREIRDGGMVDVPEGEGDLWSGGIHLTNSLIGKSQTRLEAYLFRWWCTNGAITTLDDVAAWNRRKADEEMDVYEWARTSVNEVLGGMEAEFDKVQALTRLRVPDGEAATVIREVFQNYDVPVSQRQPIIDRLIEAENLSMYTIMNAVTETANGLSPDRADRLMRIGGAIPASTFDTLKAQVWAEGHHADPEAPNPYEIAAQVA